MTDFYLRLKLACTEKRYESEHESVTGSKDQVDFTGCELFAWFSVLDHYFALIFVLDLPIKVITLMIYVSGTPGLEIAYFAV